MIWIKLLLVRIVIHNSLLLKMSRLFTRRKGSTMNHKDVLTVEEQESSKITIETTEEVTVTDGKRNESLGSLFFTYLYSYEV